MKKKYRHLISDNRTVIKTLLQENKSYAYIAGIIGVHRSTVYREIRRNSDMRGYCFMGVWFFLSAFCRAKSQFLTVSDIYIKLNNKNSLIP